MNKEEYLAKSVINYSHLYLCGHLNTDKSSKDFLYKTQYNWIKEELDKDFTIKRRNGVPISDLESFTYQDLCNMYYESFVDSLVSVRKEEMPEPYNQTAHYILDVNKECKLKHNELSNGIWIFTVLKLHLFFFPYGICLFAIEIKEEEQSKANDLTLAHCCLREVNSYMKLVERTDDNNNKYKEWELSLDAPEYLKVIEPLIELCPKPGVYENKYSCLALTGNKLKAFQIILSDNIGYDFLFELGTMSDIGCVKYHNSKNSPSDEYYNKLINENTVSLFRNWRALALFDTFTVLHNSDGKNAKNVSFTWRNFYFRLIYIHSLYQKTMLFIANRRFRSGEQSQECRNLLHDMKIQEHWYAFSNISYNFLPQLLYKAVDFGLEIDKERESLRKYIEQESERQDQQNEQRIGKLVFYITIITILSALNDGSTLIRELFGIDTGSIWHKTISAILILLITTGIVILLKKYRKIK